MRILLVILSYNGVKYFKDLFESLSRANFPKENWEIFIIDNASRDESVNFLKNKILPLSEFKFPKIHLHESSRNTGFVGNNIGMKYALENNFDYVFLLNQDVIVDSNFLAESGAAITKDEHIGAVQSLIKLWPEKALVNSLGNKIHFLGFGYSFGYRWTEDRAYEYLQTHGHEDLAYPSGAAALIRVSALRDIGLFDEKFFLYHEDLDLGWRLRLGGWRVMLEPRSVVYHKYEFARSIKKYYFMERNRFLFMLKNFQIYTFFLIAPAFLAIEAGLLLYSFKSGFWRDKLRAYAYFLNPFNLFYILRARNEVQHKRKLHDHEMYKWLSGKIEFQDIENDLLKFFVNPLLNLYWFLVKKIVLWWIKFLQAQKKEPDF